MRRVKCISKQVDFFSSHNPMLCYEANPAQYKYNPEACISGRCFYHNGVIGPLFVRLPLELLPNQ